MSATKDVSERENEHGEAESTKTVTPPEIGIEEELYTSEVGPSQKGILVRIKERFFCKKKRDENMQDGPCGMSVVHLIKLMQDCFFTKEASNEWRDALRDTQLSTEVFENLVKADVLGALNHWEQDRGKGLEWLCRNDNEGLTNRRFILLIYPFIARKHQYVRLNELENFMQQSKAEMNDVSRKSAPVTGRIVGKRIEAEEKRLSNYYHNLKENCDRFKNLQISIPPKNTPGKNDSETFGRLCDQVYSFVSQYWFEKENEDDYRDTFNDWDEKEYYGYMCSWQKSNEIPLFWKNYESVIRDLFQKS